MNIIIPASTNCPELRYSLEVLFNVFLGIDYKLTISDVANITVCGSHKNLIIPSVFFSTLVYSGDSAYSVPTDVSKDTIIISEQVIDIVSIYGTSNISMSESEITLHSDILASTFFMLSRWEEYVDKTRDIYGRFPAKASLAYKAGFFDRPIVNEYVEFLWVLLKQIGCNQKRKSRSYKLVPTHDVDKPYLFNGFGKGLKYVAGSLKRRRFSELERYANNVLKNSDPFDTHDHLMDLAELNNVEAHFFFLQKGKSKQDEDHDIARGKIKKLAKHILNRGHDIGFHPSYDAFNNEYLFTKEKEYLELNFDLQVDTGRHHFLKWDVSVTPQIWQMNNMKWDSTLGYADRAGFRCGVCYPFPLYDLVNNKQLDVYERPLVAMEWSLIHYQRLTIDKAEEEIDKLKRQVKKYNGEFVFLYHNSAFFTDEYFGKSKRLLSAFYK